MWRTLRLIYRFVNLVLGMSTLPHQVTPSIIQLKFAGPFTLSDGPDSIFRSEYKNDAGIYLWTIRQRANDKHLIHYIGETASLAKRHKEHLVSILGLYYGIWDAEKAQNGVSELIWAGLWRDKSEDGPAKQLKGYDHLHKAILKYVDIISIVFAKLDCDASLRKHIEGCIGYHLRTNHPEAKMLYPDDNRVGRMKGQGQLVLKMASPVDICGLDQEIRI